MEEQAVGRWALGHEVVERAVAVTNVLQRRAAPPPMSQIIPGPPTKGADGVVREPSFRQRVAPPLGPEQDVARMLSKNGVGHLAREAHGSRSLDH
eukprot:9049527-Lingulodinium_polyedra.AAC.1